MPRPPKPDHERRSEVFQVRLTLEERQLIEEGAGIAGEQLSEFIRTSALEKTQRLRKRFEKR